MIHTYQQGQIGRFQVLPPDPVTWETNTDPTLHKRVGSVTLSNGNKTMTCTATNAYDLATLGRSTGAYYFEISVDTPNPAGNAPHMGLTVTGFGNDPPSQGYWLTAGSPIVKEIQAVNTSLGAGNYSSTDIFGCAVDFAAGKVWFAKNNTWWSSGNPAAGTNPIATGLSGTYYPAFHGGTVVGTQPVGTLRAKAADFTYSPPSGFSAWES